MRRDVSATVAVDVTAAADMVFSVAVADTADLETESLEVLLDGEPVEVTELLDLHGTRMHRVKTPRGRLTLAYSATVRGRADPAPADDRDFIRYLRPSRYCEADSLAPIAQGEFYGLEGKALLDAVSSWVGTRISYVSGSSLPTDGAVRTLLARQGVCRDFAHLCVGLLRARDVPARLVSVYAPGLAPMDFHAVCEAFVDGEWVIIDATALAPRSSMLRIATGRDAADVAFLTTLSGQTDLLGMSVAALADVLPDDDLNQSVRLG